MKKIRLKKSVAMLVAVLLAVGTVVSIPPQKVEAASGTWVMTSEMAYLDKGYLDNEQVVRDMAAANGWSTVDTDFVSDGWLLFATDASNTMTTGVTRSYLGDEVTYIVTNTYNGKVNGNVQFVQSGGYVYGDKGHETNKVISEITRPNDTYNAGQKISLNIHAQMTDWNGETEYMTLAEYFMASIYNAADNVKLYDENGDDFWQILPYDFYHKYNNEYNISVSGTMPDDAKDGDKLTLQVHFDPGYYRCEYTFKAGSEPGKIPQGPEGTMYRLYNPNSGEHFYTADIDEANYLYSIGWNYEDYAWQAPTRSDIPVYRLYNRNGGYHHYTRDADERDGLIVIGWDYEGLAWYSSDGSGVALFRLYNPNARGEQEAGGHHYTKDTDELDYLVGLGWKYEGIGWYGI